MKQVHTAPGKALFNFGRSAPGCAPGLQRPTAKRPPAGARGLHAAERKLLFAALIGFILWLAFLPGVVALVNAEEGQEIVVTKKDLKTAAYNSLWRLQRSIERDGYYSARVALNVWRSNAIDAGVFKQEDYDQYKRQIYEKSVESNQRCFEKAIEEQNLTDANKCLLIWKLHSEEIGIFDPARYEQMQAVLQSVNAEKPQEPNP